MRRVVALAVGLMLAGPAMAGNFSDVFTTAKAGTTFTLRRSAGWEGAWFTGGHDWYDGDRGNAKIAIGPNGVLKFTATPLESTDNPADFSFSSAVSVDSTKAVTMTASGTLSDFRVVLFATAYDLKYSEFGQWYNNDNFSNKLLNSTASFATGIAATNMPKTGTASYTGGAEGAVMATSTTSPQAFAGTFFATANFAQASLTGGVKDIKVGDTGAAMNPISFPYAKITGASFAGSALVSGATVASKSAPDVRGAVGSWGGGFYGPKGAEIAGTFKLLGTANSSIIIGAFGGAKK